MRGLNIFILLLIGLMATACVSDIEGLAKKVGGGDSESHEREHDDDDDDDGRHGDDHHGSVSCRQGDTLYNRDCYYLDLSNAESADLYSDASGAFNMLNTTNLVSYSLAVDDEVSLMVHQNRLKLVSTDIGGNLRFLHTYSI